NLMILEVGVADPALAAKAHVEAIFGDDRQKCRQACLLVVQSAPFVDDIASLCFSDGTMLIHASPLFPITPFRRNSSIFSAPKPASRKISSVCCPSVGAGRWILPGVFSMCSGTPPTRIGPIVS